MEPFIQPLYIIIFSLIIGVFFVLSKLFYTPSRAENQQVIGISITFTSVVFGLLLGFTVSNFWNRYITIGDFISEEAQQLSEMYNIVKGYPGTQGIINALQLYLENTINVEFKFLAQNKTSKENDVLFKNIIIEINNYVRENPNTPIANTLYTLIPERERLKNTINASFSNYLIWIIIISAIITLVGFWLLQNENLYFQLIIDVGIIAIISLSIYLLYELKNPFSGIFQIQPTDFINLLNEIKA